MMRKQEHNVVQKELTMTVICKCGNQFGIFRRQCPACGTPTPPAALKKLEKVEEERAPRKPRAMTRQIKWHECVACRRTGAKKMRCPHCNEPIHKPCLRMHVDTCLQFQREREEEIKRLTSNVLDNPTAATNLINKLVEGQMRREKK